MSNKTQLQTNNTNLDALITRVNAAKDVAASLPEAGGSGGGVETFDLELQSDGQSYVTYIAYVSYVNGEYQYHYDFVGEAFPVKSYPITLSNIVLKTPIKATVTGGVNPMLDVVSNINVKYALDYQAGYQEWFTEMFLPLESDNGKIVVYCYDDD